MHTNFNFDKGNFQVIETHEGFLKAKVTLARPGVFQYLEGDKLTYQAKLPEHILSKKTLESAKGIPVTDDHPAIEGSYILLDSKNYKNYAKGNISEPFIEDGKLCAYETIWDADLINDIKSGKKREVSIGFAHEYDLMPGEYDGQSYDMAQTNIIINHLAHVEQGRAGNDIKIHVDKKLKEEIIMENNNNSAVGAGDNTSNANKTFSYRKFDGSKDIAVNQEVHSELMLLRNELKANQVKFDEYDKKIESLESNNKVIEKDEEIKALHETVDSWRNQFEDLKNSIPETAQKLANEKADLMDFAKSIEVSVDGLSNKEIKLQIISKGLPFAQGIKVDSLHDEVINARFDAAKELIKEKANMSTGNVNFDSSLNEKRTALQNAWEGGK